jgi:predicted acyltransferase
VSTISATASPFLGLLFGLILVHHKKHRARLVRWVVLSVLMLAAGIGIHFGGFPFNKNLYTTSYVLLMGGFAGGLLSAVYALLDIYPTRVGKWLTLPFVACGILCLVSFGVVCSYLVERSMGMNSIVIYFGDGFISSVVGDKYGQFAMIFWQSPANSLATWVYWSWLRAHLAENVSKFLYAFMDAWFWVAVGCVLYALDIFFKV